MWNRTPSAVSTIDHWLGRLATASPRCWQWLGDRETGFYQKAVGELPIDRPIYIAGLARSGTTLILEMLSTLSQTATHRYRDYPFLHTPIWWNRFLDRAVKEDDRVVERFHRDRIFITRQSPEAMEEMLWMSFFPDCHTPAAGRPLDHGYACSAFDRFYKDHIRKILFLRHGTRYVSKANYHVTRLAYLKRLFPDARFLIPVRSPVSHVASLWRQHRHFCTEEQKDPRLLEYMRRSGHFEFGLDRRPVNTGKPETVDRILKLWADGEEVRGLALAWKSVYEFISDRLLSDRALREATLVVNYDALCESPEQGLKQIYSHCGLAVSSRAILEQAQNISPAHYASPFNGRETAVIENETRDVYERMLELVNL